MNKEELIKDQFPNDEFLQSGVLQIVDKCTADLEKENAELKKKVKSLEGNMSLHEGILWNDLHKLEKENAELKSRDCWKGCLYASGKSELIHEFLQLKYNLTKAKEIMQKLIANAPDTYSGTNIELQQKKMFSFQDAVNKAEQFLNSEVENDSNS